METLAFRNSSTQRSTLFSKLKPCCLKVVQALRRGASSSSGVDDGDLARTIDDMYAILTEQAGYDATAIDASIADYAFFPLLPILQSASEPTPSTSTSNLPSSGKRRFTARVVEGATKCVRVLVQSGWKAGITKDNAQRLLVMLATLAGNSRRGEADAPEELVVEAYRALAALVRAAGAASSAPLIEANAVPLLAHAVTVMLEGATDATDATSIPAIQLEALAGIDALYSTVKDLEALATFLPGTVSALVRVVGQPGAHKTPRRVVVRALEVLFGVIAHTVGDLPTRRIKVDKKEPADDDEADDEADDKAEEEADEEIITDAAGDILAAEKKKKKKETTANNKHPSSSPSPSPSPSPSLPMRLPMRQPLDAAWLKATAGQIRMALATVLKLRSHESEDVRDAVHAFCVGLLDECHTSLHDATAILVESAIVTLRPAAGDNYASLGAAAAAKSRQGMTLTTLENLAMLYPELCDVVKTTAYNWATRLPRDMQASDEEAKQRALRNLQQAISVLDALQIDDSATLQASLAAALRDSVVALVLTTEPPKTRGAVAVAAVEAVPDDALSMVTSGSSEQGALSSEKIPPYKPILLARGSQKGTRAAMLELLAHVGAPAQKTRLAAEMLDFVRDADGLDQVAAYWLSFELVKAAAQAHGDDSPDGPDALLDLSSYGNGDGNGDSEVDAVMEDLYTFSVSLLAAHSDGGGGDYEADWRMGALAMEVTAYAAARAGEAFRPELIDVLYPVATYMGAREPRLRSHAVLTLNRLAAACGYGGYSGGGVSELIVDNVDYMLNAVSLRLNTFDISPASTQVLTMMIRLAGPRLVPYLDDVVASIFAALDNYHGYPLFVESLFGVLGEVVQQSVAPRARAMLEGPGGSRGAATSTTTTTTASHRKRRPPALTTDDLVGTLERRQKRRREEAGDADDEEEEEEDVVSGHPTRPWKDADSMLREREAEGGEDGEGEEEAAQETSEDLTKPEDPKTPTYALLARITTLTQHYLTSPTPSLRKSLLDLLAIVAPALGSSDENAYLPLVNTVWPVIVPRLYDGEPYVVVAACHALGAVCASAGDFVSTRIKDEWTGRLERWCLRVRDQAERAVKARPVGGGTAKPKPVVSKGLLISGRATMRTAAAAAAVTDIVTSDVAPSSSSSAMSLTGERKPESAAGLGRFAQAVQIWEAVVGLLTAVVAHVKMDDAVYDGIVRLLAPSLASSNVLARPLVDAAFDALAVVNSDAVWLARHRAGVVEKDMQWTRQPPVLEGVHFVALS